MTKRAGDQFSDLFIKRYQERFGRGISLKATGRTVRHTYRPASGGLSEVECQTIDVVGPPGQLGQLADLWNGCIDDLRGLSKLGVPAKGPVTVEAWEAMPEELRGDTDHPLAPRIHEIVRAAQNAASDKAAHETMVHVGLLASQIEVAQRAKLTAGQSRKLALTLERCGFNIEPDARLSGRSYGWDQPVATPRETIKDFIGLLNVLEQNPSADWRTLVAGITTTASTEPAPAGEDEDEATPAMPLPAASPQPSRAKAQDDDLASFKM